MLEFPLARRELHIESFRKILTEEMRRSSLQRLAVLHHRFNAVCVDGTGKTFTFRLSSAHDRHRHKILGKVRIDAQHLNRLLNRFFSSSVRSVAFLPEKFCSP